MKSPHFCYQPWVSIDIDNSGDITPCCKFNKKLAQDWENYNLNDNTINDYKKSNGLKKLKESFINGEKPEACERCWKDEDANYPSKRLMDYERWKEDLNFTDLTNSKTSLITLPLGNMCNLKCRICGPNASSSWIKEYQDINGQKISNNILESHDAWQSILDMCDDVLELHLHGGEPFLYDNDKHLQLLERMSKSKNASKIRLHYNTNCTIFPDKKYWDFFDRFGWVDIQPSIDDIGKRFEYNRKNANWLEVENNLFKYRDTIANKNNMQLSISTTVSVFTIYYLEEFFDYIYKNNLPKPWLGRLNKPAYYKCSIFPSKSKKLISEKLLNSKYDDLRKISNWLLDDDTIQLENFKKQILIHDSYRKECFEEIFPEVFKLLK